jgi:hypothetical protein
MFDFVTGSDLIPDSGHLTGFGIGFGNGFDIGFGLGFLRKTAVAAPVHAYGA